VQKGACSQPQHLLLTSPVCRPSLLNCICIDHECVPLSSPDRLPDLGNFPAPLPPGGFCFVTGKTKTTKTVLQKKLRGLRVLRHAVREGGTAKSNQISGIQSLRGQCGLLAVPKLLVGRRGSTLFAPKPNLLGPALPSMSGRGADA